MDEPPAAPHLPAPATPPADSRDSREASHDGDSQFSEHNPLQDHDGSNPNPSALYPAAEPKKPKAVALHGWQRTVGVDDDFDPTIPVCLGAPGTGLFTAKAAGGGGQNNNNPAGAGVGAGGGPGGAGAVVDLGNAKVTREDKKEAKSLRLQPALPDAAPLPYPRVAAVDTASESSSSEGTGTETDGDGDDGGTRKEKQRQERQKSQSQFETCSSASSDMSFLVNAASGSFLGNRQTFGRNIDPRIPATVGEERLYNSLAQYFGKSQSRRNIPGGGGGGDAESAGGESRLSDLSGPPAGGDRTLLLQQPGGGGAGSSGTPVATNSTALSASGGSGSGSTMNTNNSQTASVLVGDHTKKNGSAGVRSGSGEAGGGGGGGSASGGGGGGGESKRREGSSRGSGGGAAVTQAMVEEGRLAKQASGSGSEGVPVEPGRRLPKCKCLRRWPWKVLSCVVTLAGVVAVVVVIAVSTEGGNDSRRRLFSPQLLSANGGGYGSGSADLFRFGKGRGRSRSGGGAGCGGAGCGTDFGGVGGAVKAVRGHSRQLLSVDRPVEPGAVAGGASAAAGISAAGGGGGGGDGAPGAGASAGAGSATRPQLAGQPPGRDGVVVATAVGWRDTPNRARLRPVR